jgi:hypothetical protein
VERKLYSVLVGKPEGKRPLGTTRRRWEDVFKMDLGEMSGGCGVDSIGSGQGSMAGCFEGGDEPSVSEGTELATILWFYNKFITQGLI